MSERLRAAMAATLLTLVVAAEWGGLWVRPDAGSILLVCLLGALPSMALLAPRACLAASAVAAVVAVVGVLAVASGEAAGALAGLDSAAWDRAASTIPDGIRAASHEAVPVVVGADPALGGLLLAALGLVVAVLVWQCAVRRRPVVALAVVGGALGYRYTVVPPGRPVLAGSLVLLAGLAAVWLLRPGASGRTRWGPAAVRAAVAGGALVVASAALAAGPASRDDAWWDWRAGSLGSAGPTRAIDLDQRYGQLSWSGAPVVMFRVTSDRGTSLRAVAFERFDGLRFAEASAGRRTLPSGGGPTPTGVVPPAGARQLTQTVRLAAGRSQFVLAGGRPVSVTVPDGRVVQTVGDATLAVSPPMTRGDTYSVRTWVPDPGPRALLDAPPYDPDPTNLPIDLDIDVIPDAGLATQVQIPVWGSAGAPLYPGDPTSPLVPPPTAGDFGQYAGVYRLSREWIGDATSAYQAVNRIESRLRGGYAYDERPPLPAVGVPPLVDFLEGSRRGFCQQFAGAMALMLRMNGIPARVVVGFTAGRFDPAQGVYEVLDRDAHSWVEVWFPGQGWLPFDPTPGRSAANSASVSNPDYAPPTRSVDLGIESAPVKPVAKPPTSSPTTPDAVPSAPRSNEGGTPGWAWIAGGVLLAVLALAVAPLVRLVRRRRLRRAPDPRERVVGAVRELERDLAALGVPRDPSHTPTERGAALTAHLGVDAGDLYRRAGDARFGTRAPRADEAERAWRDAALVRREARRGAPRGRRTAVALGLVPRRRTPGGRRSGR